MQVKGVYWHLFPTYAEAKDAVWRDPQMLFNIIPRDWITKTNESELIVYLKSGSIYQLKGADNPDALRGAGPIGIVLDEYAKVKVDAWGVLEPILRGNGGWAWFIGTPKGKNHFYQLYMRGLGEHPDWKSWRLQASSSGIIPEQELLDSKKSMTEPLYNQEWECEFLQGEGQVFRNVRDILIAEPKKPETGHSYVMGVDLAKVTDFTVITVYDRANNNQVYQDRFQTLDWPYQKRKIKAIAEHYNKALVMLDATGLGDPIADDLIRDGVAVEPFKINEITKRELVEKISIWIDQAKFKMLPLDETQKEFENFAYELGPTGKIRYGAPVGEHDDVVMSHALSIYALQGVIQPIRESNINPVASEFMRQKRQYERTDSWGYQEDYEF